MTAMPDASPNDDAASSALIRCIEPWTIAFGVAASFFAAWKWGWRAGAGLAAGALLSWLNFRWLKQGVISLTGLSTAQEGADKVRVPRIVYWKFFGRFVLLLAAAYVILAGLKWPAVAVIAGLFAAVAGMLMAMIVHLLQSWRGA